MQSLFPAINTKTVFFPASVDIQVAVDRVQLPHVHIVDEPLFPHGVLRTGSFEPLVPVCRQRVGNVRAEMWSNGRLVLVKPVLNTTITRLNAY